MCGLRERETGLRQKPSQVMEQSTAETRTVWFSLEGWGERNWQLLEGHWEGRQMKPVMGEWHSYQRRKWQMWGIRSNTYWFSVLITKSIYVHTNAEPPLPRRFVSATLRQFPYLYSECSHINCAQDTIFSPPWLWFWFHFFFLQTFAKNNQTKFIVSFLLIPPILKYTSCMCFMCNMVSEYAFLSNGYLV